MQVRMCDFSMLSLEGSTTKKESAQAEIKKIAMREADLNHREDGVFSDPLLRKLPQTVLCIIVPYCSNPWSVHNAYDHTSKRHSYEY